MVNKNVVRGIGLTLVMISFVWMVMAAPSSITNLTNSTYAQDYITWTWTDPSDLNFTHVMIYINGVNKLPNVTKGTKLYNATGLTPDTTYIISTQTVDNNFSVNSTWVNHTARTAPSSDLIAPASITSLQNTTYASNSINWTWTDPTDSDFSKVIVFVNDVPQSDVLKGNQFFLATSLTPNTDNSISTHTIDTNGNMNLTWVNHTARTALPDITPPSNITNLANISGPTWIKWTWTNPTPDFDHAEVYFDDAFVTNSTTSNFNTSPSFPLIVRTTHTISLRPVDAVGNVGNWSNHTASTVPTPPTIERISPPSSESSFETIGTSTKTFTIKVVDQTANVTWAGAKSQTDSNTTPGSLVNLTFTPPATGTYYINVSASNENGTSNYISWTWTVRSKTYETGNRVWDANKGMSLKYKWSPMSFYAFYYEVNDDVGNEILEINLGGGNDRTVDKGDLIYTTKPENVTFQYKAWGGYDVIGFMADKYFAGYTVSTSPKIIESPRSTINYNQLHKILIDDKVSHTVRASSTYPLGDGYAVTLKELGAGRQAWISILKDNGEVYSEVKGAGDTIIYSKRVGSVNDLPLIALHIGNVFEGTTESMVQIDGIFQLSESYTSINSGNNYGIMSITEASDTGITMSNKNGFTLSSASTIDIMGDLKFIVAKSDTLRFAPMVKRSYEYEVRGTISNNETNNEWTPLNFEGFYYNLDEGVGTEKMTLNLTSGSRTVGKEQIIYTTETKDVQTKSKLLGSYKVIGFMAEKYFAGYNAGVISPDPISTIERNQLHKVLIDDDTQRVIYAGSTLTLNDGYVLKIKDVNMGAGTPSVWLTVLKDGNEVFDDFKEKGQVFIFEKDVGALKNLPLISLRIDSIFRGTEATAAFVKGTFQISESYTSVNVGQQFDKMEIDEITGNNIIMTNPNTVTLDSGKTDTLMKNIKLKVADSSVIRFYPFVLVNGSALSANQLGISVPSSIMVKDTITISVTSVTGTAQDNAEVSFDGMVIGTTNSTGKLDYMLTKAGQHNFTATKLGYEKAVLAVQIAEYVDNRLSLVLPEFIDQYVPVSIKVIVSGSGNAITGANITLDGTSVGTTDSSGIMTYTFTDSGKHNLAASKSGYISVQREIDVRMPFIEFTALDINFRPDIVAKGQNVYVWSNITNSGTKEGMLPVALIINNTVVENKNVTLVPGQNGEVNFSHKIELPIGNYTIEILGQKTTMPVKEEPLNLFLVVGVITGLGALTVYFLTSKNLMSVEAIKSKMNMETVNQAVAKTKSSLESLTSKFMKGGGKGGSPPPKFDPFKRFDK